MDAPAPPRRPISPFLAIVLTIFVGMFSLLFGLGVLFDSEAHVSTIVRVLVPVDLLIAPVFVAVRLRSLGRWTALAAGAIASGTTLFVCVPAALMAPTAVGVVLLLAGLAAMIFAPDAIVRSRVHRAVPLRRDA